jgi:hypothetical protein
MSHVTTLASRRAILAGEPAVVLLGAIERGEFAFIISGGAPS